ncbi:MAG: SET domain-containing protein-lysine N-methyltransferase [Parachlamydiaceae bacterium]
MKKNKEHKITILKKGALRLSQLTQSEFKDYFNIDYYNHLQFPSEAAFQETLNNCPWIIETSYLGEKNRQLFSRFRKEIEQGFVADVSIRWINEELGYGLYANKNLPAEAYIGEFTGLVRRLYRRSPDHNEYCFHYPTKWWSWKYTVIDALLGGNETRFINHSDKPNLQPLCVCDQNLLHIIFITDQPIKAGMQLTYHYGNDFWKHRRKIET